MALVQASDVPRYDRQCNALDVQDSSTAKTNKQGHILVPESIARPPRASQRCFNCGSYGHGLKVLSGRLVASMQSSTQRIYSMEAL